MMTVRSSSFIFYLRNFFNYYCKFSDLRPSSSPLRLQFAGWARVLPPTRRPPTCPQCE
jgi:hypothetical protein